MFFKKQVPFLTSTYLVCDLELTGLNPEEDSIISAGTVLVRNGQIEVASAEHYYFLPTTLLADDVTNSAHIHMITDEQREQNGIEISAWLSDLSTRLLADAWVFHHAPIDLKFLTMASQRLNISLPKVPIVDTLIQEQKRHKAQLLESQSQLSLNACRARYGLPVYRQHHALSDALATAELWLAQNSVQ
ncbi:exonuclease domain-containing protein [Reinekea marina]|uniref:Exonuclease domain-containing protein n=1 Tax=Reinekea marina TaxID=1310421 RepID=A0ABV7WNH2_9GAMM